MTGFFKGFALFFGGLTIGGLAVFSAGSLYLNFLLVTLAGEHFDLKPLGSSAEPTLVIGEAPTPPSAPIMVQNTPLPSVATYDPLFHHDAAATPGALPSCPISLPGQDLSQSIPPLSPPQGDSNSHPSGCAAAQPATDYPFMAQGITTTSLGGASINLDLAFPLPGMDRAGNMVIGFAHPVCKDATGCPGVCMDAQVVKLPLPTIAIQAIRAPQTTAKTCCAAGKATCHSDLPASQAAMCAEATADPCATCPECSMAQIIEKLEKRIAELEQRIR